MTEALPDEEVARLARLREQLLFCPMCFASDEDGSWNHVVVAHYCTNCGAGYPGGALSLPRWAVDAIRQNASWVGKRYYPADEDHEAAEERKDLLELVDEFPGRAADYRNGTEDSPAYWWVTQKLPGGRAVCTSIGAEGRTAEQAMRDVHLRYVPAHRLDTDITE